MKLCPPVDLSLKSCFCSKGLLLLLQLPKFSPLTPTGVQGHRDLVTESRMPVPHRLYAPDHRPPDHRQCGQGLQTRALEPNYLD